MTLRSVPPIADASEGLSVFGELEPVVLRPQHVRKRAAVVVLRHRGVERRQLVVLGGVDRLHYLLDRAIEHVGRLVKGRRTTQLDR